MKLKTKEAMLYILGGKTGPSKYQLAKQLKVQPIMISHYLNGSRMKQDKANLVEEIFGITITDVYNPTHDALKRAKNAHETKGISGK